MASQRSDLASVEGGGGDVGPRAVGERVKKS
jgi:hypothetical protein